MEIKKSDRLSNVSYEIRGPIYDAARDLEKKGVNITRLHIGNPSSFGFDVPEEIAQDIILNLREAQGYTESGGMFAARKAIMHNYQLRGIKGVGINDIIIGNGVSEIIQMAMQALLNHGDEVLVPAPDYPLWSASIILNTGTPVYYICDEQQDWIPDLADLESKITSRTKAIVLINPNNPTGAVYPADVLQKMARIAEEHKLIVFSDEIYDRILYDDVSHTPMSAFVEDTLCITMNGLSKNYRAPGFRAGWLVISGKKDKATSYIEGLNQLAAMRLCSNALAQVGIQTALGGYQSITELTLPGGRLRKQRDFCYDAITAIPGISCVKPKGAFYMFPKFDKKMFSVESDKELVMDILMQKKILVVQGSGFNWQANDHFRIVYLPNIDTLEVAMANLGDYFAHRAEKVTELAQNSI